ncbi:hypothetical protein ACROYT_G034120, partial [Oculina patagonica]
MPENSKKNKRGARGSTDDEVNEAKRPFNMDDKTSKEAEAEPILSDLKAMLLDLQGSVNAILKDNKSLKDEISALKTSFDAQGREFNKLKESVDKLKSENESLKGELLRTKVKLEKQQEETDNLWTSLDDLEQYTRKNSLEISGVPETCYTSTEEVVLKVANVLEVDLTPNDIEISHKLKRRGARNTIIAKFVSHKAKSKLYKQRTKLKDIKLADLYPSFASAINTDRIFINENLTNFRRYLFGKANGMKKDDLVSSVWSID